MTCEHEASSLELIEELEYEPEDHIHLLMKDVCQECGEELGREVHVYRFSHIKDWGRE